MVKLPDLIDVWTETNQFQDTETDVRLKWTNGATACVQIQDNLEYGVTARWPDGADAGMDSVDADSAFEGGLRVINAYLNQKQGDERLEENYPAVHAVLTI